MPDFDSCIGPIYGSHGIVRPTIQIGPKSGVILVEIITIDWLDMQVYTISFSGLP